LFAVLGALEGKRRPAAPAVGEGRAVIVSAATPVIAAAQLVILGCRPSPEQIALEDGPSHGVARQKIAFMEALTTSVWGSPLRAVGAGMLDIHSAPAFVRQVCPQRTHQDELAATWPGRALRRGADMLEMLPPAIMLFLRAMPPKASTISLARRPGLVSLRLVRSS
jgi:hypothetical protein